MWCRLAVIFVVLSCSLMTQPAFAINFLHSRGPCSILDTINITSGYLDNNGNFHHNGVVYEDGTFAEYDYIVKDFKNKIKVEPHIRGCICKYRPCIRLCCDDNDNNTSCVKTDSIIVPTSDDEIEIDLFGKQYGVLVGRPCKEMYILEPAQYEYDRWSFTVSILL